MLATKATFSLWYTWAELRNAGGSKSMCIRFTNSCILPSSLLQWCKGISNNNSNRVIRRYWYLPSARLVVVVLVWFIIHIQLFWCHLNFTSLPVVYELNVNLKRITYNESFFTKDSAYFSFVLFFYVGGTMRNIFSTHLNN